MRERRWRRAAPLLLCLACLAGGLAGCFGLPRKSVPPRPWLLAPIAGDPRASDFSMALGVGPVEFPEYLNRPEIVERVGPNELRASEFEIWGEPLRASFQNTLSSNLRVLVPGLAVVEFPWKGPADVDYRLGLAVARFEHDVPSGAIVLDASWGLLTRAGRRPLARRIQTFREPVQGDDTAAVTAAMSGAVAALSREIAADLAKLEASPPPARTEAE